MDGEFIGQRELILGGVGIGVTIVLLVILSLLQTSRAKREGAQRLDKLKEDNSGLADAPRGATPFFVARYQGNNARFFRVYAAANELLFLYAGQYFVLIDAESVRGTDTRPWLLRSAKLIYLGLATLAVGSVIGGAAILRAVARNAAQNPGGARDILTIVGGIIAFLACLVVVGIPLTLWTITRRCRELDEMSLNDLRSQSELHPKSFRATPESVSEINVDLLDQRDNMIPSFEVGCTFTFKHAHKGRWIIQTITTRDTRDAVQALLAAWGQDRVSVDPKLRQRLGLETAVPAPAAPVESKPVAAAPAAVSAAAASTSPPPHEESAEAEDVKGGTYSINGCGTMCVEARGEVDWGDRLEDADAILAVCFLGVPIVPYRAVHTTGWQSHDPKVGLGGHRYRSIPIRWSWDLVAKAFVWRILFFWVMAGLFFSFTAFAGSKGWSKPFPGLGGQNAQWLDTYRFLIGSVVVALLIVLPFVVRWGLKRIDRRHCDIRLLLGRHLLGSSDPAYWTETHLHLVPPAQNVFGTPTFSEAVPRALESGDFMQAMFAARLTAALGNRRRGEELTDQVLRHPNVQEVLRKLRHDPSRRDEILGESEWKSTRLFAAWTT